MTKPTILRSVSLACVLCAAACGTDKEDPPPPTTTAGMPAAMSPPVTGGAGGAMVMTGGASGGAAPAGGQAGVPSSAAGGGGVSGSAGGLAAGNAGAAGADTAGAGGASGAEEAGGGGESGSGDSGTGGDSGSGGDSGTGGSSGTGGTGGSGGTGGGSGSGGTGGTGGSGTMIGDGGTVRATIVVRAGQTFDGQNKRYTAGPELGDGSQSESQKPVFKLEDGAKLINVVLGSPAADGIHCYGDVTLQNIVWEDIGEDALTIKESGTVVLDGGSARNGEDKVFQINAASTFRVSNFTASNAGKFIRQNGGTTFKVQVFIDECDISNMDEAIFRTDSSTSTVSMTNTRYHAIGDSLWIGVSPGNITVANNTEY